MGEQHGAGVEPLLTDQYALAATIPFLIVGTLGNILTLVVLHRPAFRNKSFAVYLRALAIADTGVIWIGLRTIQIFQIGRTTMKMEWEHRVQTCLFSIVSIFSSWTIVLVTLERVIIVLKPEKAKVLCTKRRAILAVVLIWVIIGVSSVIYANLSEL